MKKKLRTLLLFFYILPGVILFGVPLFITRVIGLDVLDRMYNFLYPVLNKIFYIVGAILFILVEIAIRIIPQKPDNKKRTLDHKP